MNAMQLMHGMYNVHNYLPSEIFQSLWEKESNAHYSFLPAPILTQWWSVGLCAATLDKEWDVRNKINYGLVNLPPIYISGALRKIEPSTKNLIGKKEI